MEVRIIDPLEKGKAAAQGETRVWGDGVPRKKVGLKWVVVSTPQNVEKVQAKITNTSSQYFDHALTSNLGGTVELALEDMGIADHDQLVSKIKNGSADTAHRIYKHIVDKVNAETAPSGDKRAVVDLIGRSLVSLKKQYATKPKTTLRVKKTSKTTGKLYYEPKENDALPTLKASALSTAKKKMAGWSITGNLESKHVRGMIKTKAAKLISGKIDSKKKWNMPEKARDMDLKYKGKSLMITVRQTGGKKLTTARVEIQIPYAYAKAYLQNHIKSKRTRSNFIFRMEHSAGYRKFIERSGV